jgi:indolepyruvate ferredoxin oxidoreductase
MRTVSISDRYEATEGTVLLSGIEALVRLLLTQRRLDRARNLSTALFISGYEGSPLGGLDQQLQRAHALLSEADIVFSPGLNEELAATAVGGTQLTGELPGRRVDGVVGFWYGKNPGFDRAADAIRHASVSGTSPLGGAVALVGDDPLSKSSTLPSSCEQTARALGLPVLAPASVGDVVPLGLHAVALSRYAGVWSAVKIVADIADASATVTIPPLGALGIPSPDRTRLWHPRTLVGPGALEAEEDFVGVRIPRVHEYTELAGLNRITSEPTRPRLAILASGTSYTATVRALSDLGLSAHDQDDLGLRLVKINMPWPLSTFALRAMVDRVHEVLVIEDKAAVVEEQLKSALYRQPHQPRIYGKEDHGGRSLIPRHGAVTSDLVARALARLWHDEPLPASARLAIDRLNRGTPIRIDLGGEAPAPRTPYFCSGCPHNISTRADDDQLVGLGIGCHIMAALDDEGRGHKIGMTQMGGEGAQWIGMSPFTDDRHYAQNLGDGTFFHSGSLAVRAAVAAGVTMTYKILYNDAVAMTGGQTPIGRVGVPALTHWLAMEGVKKVIVTTPDTRELAHADLHPIASVVHRDETAHAQHELARIDGVTALIHHDPCAAEERRLRTRGQRPALTESVWINDRVCEGCGDCAEQATCMSLVHVETEFGTKMSVHQGSCNLDRSCVKGECPSFVIARHPVAPTATVQSYPAAPTAIPDPPKRPWSGETVIRMPGIGGTGVVTASRIVQMAAHLGGLHAAGIDQTGLAQKGGPVTSDVRIASSPIRGDVHASPGGADLLLGFDLIGAAGDDALSVASPTRTVAVLNTAEVPTASMLRHQGTSYPLVAGLRSRIARATRAADLVCVDAQAVAERLTGAPLAANLVLIGAALQTGLLPFGVPELAEAIRLNGVDVPASLAAIEWGRAAVASPAIVARALAPAEEATPAEPTHRVPPAHLEPAAEWPAALRRVVTVRVAELIDFQSERVARDYLEHVRRVARRELEATQDPHLSLTELFARGLFALVAVKDEYEVARLHLLDAEQEAFARAFPGARPVYMLKPPILARLGLRRKIKLVRSARPAFRLLRAGRRLRGTPFDVFGWSAERRDERRFLADYLAWVAGALEHLSPATVEAVGAVIDGANAVHGYAHVRQASMATVRNRSVESLAALTGRAQPQQARFPIAG